MAAARSGSDFKVDRDRLLLSAVGMNVRAEYPDGQVGTVDIAHLTRESLVLWLDRQGKSYIVNHVVMRLLGHKEII